MAELIGSSDKPGVAGVTGSSSQFNGVLGISTANGHSGVAGVHDEGVGNGVYGRSKAGDGVQGWTQADGHGGVVGVGQAQNSNGVYGKADGAGAGVLGESAQGQGVCGVSHSSHGGVVGVNTAEGPGIYGKADVAGAGVLGESVQGQGVCGISHSPNGGVVGINDWPGDGTPGSGGNGGWFESTQGEGVRGMAKNPNHGGVVGVNTAGGVGVYGEGRVAGFFKGDVEVTGDIRLLNADCAEDFTVGAQVLAEPGSVMVLGEEGALFPCLQAYDKRVAGVISGAGDFKPGIVLDKQSSKSNRQPVALLGKVYCKVDAQYGAIEIGDLLTTSPTLGHAMKAADPLKAFGAIIGKALRPLQAGQGLIPILVALQ